MIMKEWSSMNPNTKKGSEVKSAEGSKGRGKCSERNMPQ